MLVATDRPEHILSCNEHNSSTYRGLPVEVLCHCRPECSGVTDGPLVHPLILCCFCQQWLPVQCCAGSSWDDVASGIGVTWTSLQVDMEYLLQCVRQTHGKKCRILHSTDKLVQLCLLKAFVHHTSYTQAPQGTEVTHGSPYTSRLVCAKL